jgi:Cysteine rich repeat
MKKSGIALIVAMLFLTVPLISQSQDLHRQGPCKADIEKFCKEVKPGKGRIIRCMKAHENEVSQACKNAIAAEREKEKEFKNACSSDVAKFCKGTKRGQGRVISCLKSHQAELAAPCKAYFQR